MNIVEQKAAQKAYVVDEVRARLGVISSERREPDSWERTFLWSALHAAAHGLYPLARLDARDAGLPPADRVHLRTMAETDGIDLASLRRTVEAIDAEPPEVEPVFGQIIYC